MTAARRDRLADLDALTDGLVERAAALARRVEQLIEEFLRRPIREP